MDYNIIIDVISLIIVCVIFFAEHRQLKTRTQDNRFLHCLMVCVLTIFLTDIPGLMLNGADFPFARLLIWIFNTSYWLLHALYGWVWVLFVDYRIFHSQSHLKKFRWLYALPMLLEIILILTNPLTGLIFTINADNEYVIGSAYLLNLIPYFLYVIASLVITLYGYFSNSLAEQKRRCLLLIIFMLLPICGVLLEIFAYGVTWVWPLTSLSLLMLYVNAQQQYISDERISSAMEKEKAAMLEKSLINTRIKIMLSQIQPHFLYNSLAVIQALCETEPHTAGVAMKNFSDFLRVNMTSLTMEKTISFEQELIHTKNYLSLEKLRFADAIHVEYDIQATFFRMPTLSLQPIVENAVRYGIMKREDGGTIKISTCETEKSFIVTVSDDGIGFDILQKKDDGRTHIGITNVSNRLREICDGTLAVQSIPNVGTTAVITIPKEGDCR